MDIIFIRELKTKTLIGIYPWERKVAQAIQIDIEIALPTSKACQTDNFEDTLDYASIIKRINESLSQKQFSLPAYASHKRIKDAAESLGFMNVTETAPGDRGLITTLLNYKN